MRPLVHRGSRVGSGRGGRVAIGGAAPEGEGSRCRLNAEPTAPIPTGQAGQPGFYAAGAEFVMLFQSKAIGYQTIAIRGISDSFGTITGVPGTFLGSRGSCAADHRHAGW